MAKKNTVVILRVSEYEKKRMEFRAKQNGLTVSEYLRQLVVTNDLKNEIKQLISSSFKMLIPSIKTSLSNLLVSKIDKKLFLNLLK